MPVAGAGQKDAAAEAAKAAKAAEAADAAAHADGVTTPPPAKDGGEMGATGATGEALDGKVAGEPNADAGKNVKPDPNATKPPPEDPAVSEPELTDADFLGNLGDDLANLPEEARKLAQDMVSQVRNMMSLVQRITQDSVKQAEKTDDAEAVNKKVAKTAEANEADAKQTERTQVQARAAGATRAETGFGASPKEQLTALLQKMGNLFQEKFAPPKALAKGDGKATPEGAKPEGAAVKPEGEGSVATAAGKPAVEHEAGVIRNRYGAKVYDGAVYKTGENTRHHGKEAARRSDTERAESRQAGERYAAARLAGDKTREEEAKRRLEDVRRQVELAKKEGEGEVNEGDQLKADQQVAEAPKPKTKSTLEKERIAAELGLEHAEASPEHEGEVAAFAAAVSAFEEDVSVDDTSEALASFEAYGPRGTDHEEKGLKAADRSAKFRGLEGGKGASDAEGRYAIRHVAKFNGQGADSDLPESYQDGMPNTGEIHDEKGQAVASFQPGTIMGSQFTNDSGQLVNPWNPESVITDQAAVERIVAARQFLTRIRLAGALLPEDAREAAAGAKC